MNKRKVLFVIPSLSAGGAEKITNLLSRGLSNAGYNVTVLSISKSDTFFKYNESDKVKIVMFDFSKIYYSLFSIRKYIKKEQPDFIISMITFMNIVVSFSSFKLNYNHKVFLRETNVLNKLYKNKNNIRTYIKHWLNRVAYNQSTKIICQSNYMKNDIHNVLKIPVRKLIVINNPVLIDSKNIDAPPFDLIAVGNLTEVKGYHRLIKIASILKKKRKFSLGIIGDGPLMSDLKEMVIENDLQNYVKLLGFISDPFSFLTKAKVFVMTSEFESFPNAVIEAGMAGIPTVAYDVPGGLRELVHDDVNGYLIKNNDSEEFCNNVIKLLNNPLDKQKIKKYTSENYNFDDTIKRYIELFKN